MNTYRPPAEAPGPGADLESCLAAVEQRLRVLSNVLGDSNAQSMEQHAGELHRALATAVQRFRHAARNGGVPPSLRSRLAHATAQLAARRDSLARATAALDRAIDVLLPVAAAPATAQAEASAPRPQA